MHRSISAAILLDMSPEDREERARILVGQAGLLIRRLGVDVSGVETRNPAQEPWRSRPQILHLAADAYDQLAFAERKTDPVLWERTTEEHGRNGDEIMRRLWELLVEVRQNEAS